MRTEKRARTSETEYEDDSEEEPGEEIESAPPLKVGEEREINKNGLKKKLLKSGLGWETPDFPDEVTGIFFLSYVTLVFSYWEKKLVLVYCHGKFGLGIFGCSFMN